MVLLLVGAARSARHFYNVAEYLQHCARQDGDIQKIPTLSYVSYPNLKSHAVWALYLSHTENETEKNGWGGVQCPPPLPLRVKF